MGGISNRFDGGARHLVLVALARDLQVEQLELLLERELLVFEGELRVELHLLVRGVRRDLGLLGLCLRRDLGVLGVRRRRDRRRRRVVGIGRARPAA